MHKGIYDDSNYSDQVSSRNQTQIYLEWIKESKEIFQTLLPTPDSFFPIRFPQIAHQLRSYPCSGSNVSTSNPPKLIHDNNILIMGYSGAIQ